jgi:hypothetical protein
VLYALPGVREAAVVGVPDEVLGRAIRAVVVLAEGVTLDARAVIAHCRSQLEDFMVPREVEFRDSLPGSCGQEPALFPGPLGSGGRPWISPQGRRQGCRRCS